MKISIVMAVYNSAPYLEASISSVLEQTFTDFELLLIDDGSQDDSWKICKEFEGKDNRIRAVHKENQGVSAVRNLGLSMCRGEYIRFFDADDIMPKDSLECLIQPMIRNEEVDLVIGRFESNDEVIFWGDDTEGLQEVQETVQHFLKYARTFYYGVMWNKMYRADIIKENNIQFKVELQWSEDLFFNLLYIEHCKKIYYIKDSVCFYYRRGNSLSDTKKTYNELEQISIEISRFEAIHRYIVFMKPDKELEMMVYDFVFVTLNQTLNFILDNPKYKIKEKYTCFVGVAAKEDVQRVVEQYTYRNAYLANRIMIGLIKGGKYRLLFVFYYVKHVMKKSQKFTDYLSRNKKVLPKFPL